MRLSRSDASSDKEFFSDRKLLLRGAGRVGSGRGAGTGGQEDFAVVATLSHGLSGGDILNICLNAIYAGSTAPNPERWLVMQAMIEVEIA